MSVSPTYSVRAPKKLTQDQFSILKGTALFETMFRNRLVVETNLSGMDKAEAEKNIHRWLTDNCNTFFFFDTSDGRCSVYIEGDSDVLNFKMFFDNQEVVLPPPPPPPPPRPAPLHKSYSREWNDDGYLDEYCDSYIEIMDTINAIKTTNGPQKYKKDSYKNK